MPPASSVERVIILSTRRKAWTSSILLSLTNNNNNKKSSFIDDKLPRPVGKDRINIASGRPYRNRIRRERELWNHPLKKNREKREWLGMTRPRHNRPHPHPHDHNRPPDHQRHHHCC